ncbi:hypothetical protein DYB37_008930 [Aphanomyces astaci]|nr:hypothetical protein DYB25_009471 [Aphanomyces astaci]RHY23974.1 hypothetical protein DYB36_012430 [Aphanomyces astaci]RHY40379.1 hypothetical protein DYB38_011391 [Aphanomyces astaci]RHY41882.1 hypothetical protein DYB34_011027 [Aphanomyces astaci]RHY47968.1 hypothetical protein DYB30_011585 [Aphanomyces astaci]
MYAVIPAPKLVPDPLPWCLDLPKLKSFFNPLSEQASTEACRKESGFTLKVQLGARLPPTPTQVSKFFNSTACRDFFMTVLDVYVTKVPMCLVRVNATYSVENSVLSSLTFDKLKDLYGAYQRDEAMSE